MNAPFHHAILIEDAGDWEVFYTGEDLADCKRRAMDWADAHPGNAAVVVDYRGHLATVPKVVSFGDI